MRSFAESHEISLTCSAENCLHHGEGKQLVPLVCTIEVNPAEDFVAAPPSNDTKSSRRVLTLPVQFRYDYEEDGQLNMKLFGHPSMIYMGNKVQGEVLFSAIERLMPYQTPYKVVLTDGQGYHCSRCMYNLHCNGCELVREVEITLQSDDHLTVVCADVSTTILQYSQQVTDHESMKDLRSTEPLTLQECFYAFTESEILDEHNPWYCPKCERNQCARKTLTVWRYPDTLVVYLKRFVFHELCSTKLDNKVLFPVENLDVSSYTSGPTNGQSLTYDLQSAVCHFGGVNAGHYTAFTKNPLTNQWCYFNDEMTTKQEPTSEDAASVYVLFYQKKGIQHDFYSALRSIVKQEFQTENSDSATAETREGCDLNHDEIDLLLQQLQSPIGADTSCAAVIPGCSKQSSTGATSCATVTGLDIKF
uniref:ubiquitinyl hydrolase 1 n=1 Tax=Saccoglossus kowalevskii TaxID=10224 RepID=A0ABM0MPP2_SACKO|nr:PREDICTED: probable ubiquitin carboxyl-terminal hydrolase 4-like [Saccoglossus kowalevskii]